MPFSGVIFDFNGVLFWDGDLHEAAWNVLAERLRGTPFTAWEIAERVHGRTNRDILTYLLNRPVSAAEATRLSAEKEELYRRQCLDHPERLRLSPGAERLLEALTAGGVPHAIATSSGPENVAFFIEHLPLRRWFPADRIICDDGRRPGKPAPDIYLDAAAALGLEPGACVIVEDAPSGIQAAERAGAGYIVAVGPGGAHENLTRLGGVSQVVEQLDEIPLQLWR